MRNKKKLTPDNTPIDQRKGRMLKVLINVLTVVFVAVFLYSGYRVYDIMSTYRENRKLQSEMQAIFYEHDQEINAVTPGEKQEGAVEENTIDQVTCRNPLESLQKVNEQVVAWIRIDDTVIDYPVVRGDDNGFYLNHDIYGNYTACGSIFMDYRSTMRDALENVVIYGHRMNDESMFGELIQFTKEDFFKAHPEFTLITEEEVYRCEVFAAYKTTTDFEYYQLRFADEGEFLEYIEECRFRSVYTNDVEVTASDRILTLSTCDSTLHVNKGRLVVQAKLVPVTAQNEE